MDDASLTSNSDAGCLVKFDTLSQIIDMGTLSDSKISWLWRNRAARNRQSRQTSVKQQGGFLCLTSFDLIYYVLELNRRARTKLWLKLLTAYIFRRKMIRSILDIS